MMNSSYVQNTKCKNYGKKQSWLSQSIITFHISLLELKKLMKNLEHNN